MAASRIGNLIAANVAISLGRRVLDGEEIEKCARGVDAELKETRETLRSLQTFVMDLGDSVERHWCQPDSECDGVCRQIDMLISNLEPKESNHGR